MEWAAEEFGGLMDPIRVAVPSRSSGGLAFWLLEVWRRWSRRSGRSGRGAGGEDGRQLTVVESLMVGPRQRVHLVRCGREHFLVATGADGVSNLIQVGANALRGDDSRVDPRVDPKVDPRVVGLPTYGDERWN